MNSDCLSAVPSPGAPRVLIADDHPVFRHGLRTVLEQDGFEVVGEAGNGDEALALLKQLRPAAVVLDVTMPGTPSITVAERILTDWPGIAVVMLTMHEDPRYLRDFLRVGAHGYVVKKSTGTELAQALHAALAGKRYVDPALAGDVLANPVTPPMTTPTPTREELSAHECELATLLAMGHTNREIAERLQVSERTVESHRASLQHKLGINSRSELVRWAAGQGLLDDDLTIR